MLDLFEVEEPIRQRIRDKVPEVVEVYTVTDLDEVPENQRKFPCAFLLYDGEDPVAGDGRSSNKELQLCDQNWYVILAVRNVRDQASGIAARKDAGPIAIKLLKALQGWAPNSTSGPMTRVGGVRPGYKAGHLYLPFKFTTRITI